MSTDPAPIVVFDHLSSPAQSIIKTNHPRDTILYANEILHYDGMSEFGPEIEIARFQIVLRNSHAPKYTYMTYYKECVLGAECDLPYHVLYCMDYENIDAVMAETILHQG
jgi:hypothetical protein